MSTTSRWRLVLGRFAEQRLSLPLSARDARMEAALDYLYSREYEGRGVRERQPAGTLDPSQLNIPTWLGEVRELFPRDVVEVIEKHALDRYGLTELVTDKETLEKLEPNMDLLKTLLTFRGHLQGEVLQTARRIIRQVVEELKRKLEAEVRRALAGRLNRFRHSPQKAAQNFDWRGTVRRNLKHFDPQRRQLILQEPRFFARNTRQLPWQVILCVDQSGSMADSVIHSAVMAGILAGLPLIRVKLVVFDTSIVDLSDHVEDPVEVLMSVQLGGGTDIGKALAYCEQLVENPHRTVVVLVSDFCEGASPAVLLNTCRRIRESGAKLLGLASLDQTATPIYDRAMADKLAEAGMEIAALTPKHLAEWLAKIVNSK
ncbi:MAG: VWA containing CoxE family protein [Limisphaerales bacterium]|nr:MAG: VWA containing CoxE family protein [Limisphaerales bacterium]TXT47766.1 MAG: VWA containing CoxE family protein [Limisphaerales bacterium]